MGAALTVSEEHATPAEIIRSRWPFRPSLKLVWGVEALNSLGKGAPSVLLRTRAGGRSITQACATDNHRLRTDVVFRCC